MAYFDLFIAPVKTETRENYRAWCAAMQPLFIDLGATEVVDIWGEDVPDGKVTSLPLAIKLEPGESVAAGYVVWPSKEARDAGWAKFMSDSQSGAMPFDGKRMIFGGFSQLAATRS